MTGDIAANLVAYELYRHAYMDVIEDTSQFIHGSPEFYNRDDWAEIRAWYGALSRAQADVVEFIVSHVTMCTIFDFAAVLDTVTGAIFFGGSRGMINLSIRLCDSLENRQVGMPEENVQISPDGSRNMIHDLFLDYVQSINSPADKCGYQCD